MTERKPLRIIQWATGSVGRYAIDAITDDPELELVGAWVHSESKDGMDLGTIAGIAPIGVCATRDANALLATPADCVLYAPLLSDVDEICRILESGKNVITPTGFSYIKDPLLAARIDSACTQGGTSFHGSGIHPGFAGDRLPLVLSALCRRIDKITVYEVFDLSKATESPDMIMGQLGFGMSAVDAAQNPPALMDVMSTIFNESMDMLAAGLGFELDGYGHHHDFALAQSDLQMKAGRVCKGHVGGQYFEYTGLVKGQAVIQFKTYWTAGRDLEPKWPFDEIAEYIVEVEGDPTVRVSLTPINPKDNEPAMIWTAMNCINAIKPVCDAKVGIRTSLDLPIIRAEGRFNLP